MKRMREWGYDLYRVDTSINDLIRSCKIHNLQIFDIWMKEEHVYFSAPIVDRRKILNSFHQIEFIKTTGMFGFLAQQLKKPRRMIGIFTSVITIFICSNTIFTIQIRGSSQLLEQKINDYLVEEELTAPLKKFSLQQFQQAEQKLKQTFFEDIEWINLSRVGGAYFIDYVPRKKESPKPKTSDPLIAHQSGIVARFELKRGVKLVKEL